MDTELDIPVDSLFDNILGPDYWVADSGVSRRSWEILLLRKAMLDDHDWSLAECAARYGISRERVRQLEQEAIAKLLAWKRAQDDKRAEEHRQRKEAARRRKAEEVVCSAPAFTLYQLVTKAQRKCAKRLSPAHFLNANESEFAPTRPRWTFAQLRARLLDALVFDDPTSPE